MLYRCFFFNDTATTEIYTLSLHDALPIYEPDPGAQPPHARAVRAARGPARAARPRPRRQPRRTGLGGPAGEPGHRRVGRDRKSTRLNSSHANISYAVFCLKKKKKQPKTHY